MEYRRDLDPTDESLPHVRHEVERWLSRQRVEGAATEDAALVVSELVADAIDHGGDEPVGLFIHVDDGAVVIRVESADLPHVRHLLLELDENRVGGRRRRIVSALADRTCLELDGLHRTASCRISLSRRYRPRVGSVSGRPHPR